MTADHTPAQKKFYHLMATLKAGDVLHVPIKYSPMRIIDTTSDCTVVAPVPDHLQTEHTHCLCVLREIAGILFLSDFAPDERDLRPHDALAVEWDKASHCLLTMKNKVPLWYSEDIMVERGAGTQLAEQYAKSIRN